MPRLRRNGHCQVVAKTVGAVVRRRDLDAWIAGVVDRHAARFDRPALLKAIRALSARYVEQRSTLSRRSAVDSAGKRAAFAAYYAPLHALTTRAVIEAIAPAAPHSVIDLGCGTAAASLGWASALPALERAMAIDINGWALDEAAWNCRCLGLPVTTRRTSFPTFVADAGRRRDTVRGTVWTAAWSINELDADDRDRLLPGLLALHRRGAAVLVVEPLSRRATPWWDAWSDVVRTAGGRTDEWKFTLDLPDVLADLDEAAGFRRDALGARTIWLPGSQPLR